MVHRSGALYRIDRLVVDGDCTTVIDFKTGGEQLEEIYREQVHTYMGMVQDLFPEKTVRGVLAYIDRRHLVEVK